MLIDFFFLSSCFFVCLFVCLFFHSACSEGDGWSAQMLTLELSLNVLECFLDSLSVIHIFLPINLRLHSFFLPHSEKFAAVSLTIDLITFAAALTGTQHCLEVVLKLLPLTYFSRIFFLRQLSALFTPVHI